MVKDRRKHIESLRDGRQIFLDGARIDDPIAHPVDAFMATYDLRASELGKEV